MNDLFVIPLNADKEIKYFLYNYKNISKVYENRKNDLIDSINVSNRSWLNSLNSEYGNTLENILIKFENDRTLKRIELWKKIINSFISNLYDLEDKNYYYVDASTVLGSSSKFGKGNEDKERYILDGNKVVYINNKGEEVTEMWYEKRMAPEGVGVVNPAFDVTDHSLVTGIITEKGIAYEPFKESFEKMGIKPVEKYVDKK